MYTLKYLRTVDKCTLDVIIENLSERMFELGEDLKNNLRPIKDIKIWREVFKDIYRCIIVANEDLVKQEKLLNYFDIPTNKSKALRSKYTLNKLRRYSERVWKEIEFDIYSDLLYYENMYFLGETSLLTLTNCHRDLFRVKRLIEEHNIISARKERR